MSRSQPDALIIASLRRKGYRATPQRIAICQYILQSRDHPSVQRIYDEVKKVHPTVSLATVYNTLQILAEHGLVQELGFPRGHARFDSDMEPHLNLVCLRCGDIQDTGDPAVGGAIAGIAAKREFSLTGQRLDLYGVCRKCQGRAK